MRKARRERGALMTIYKCVTGIIEIDKEDFIQFNKRDTRGHKKKIQVKQGCKDAKSKSFPNKWIETWNKLPKDIVNAKNIHQFKKMYDEMIQVRGTQ